MLKRDKKIIITQIKTKIKCAKPIGKRMTVVVMKRGWGSDGRMPLALREGEETGKWKRHG